MEEDIMDGSCCICCGQYFEHPDGGIYSHGHPVVCLSCSEEIEWLEFPVQDPQIETF